MEQHVFVCAYVCVQVNTFDKEHLSNLILIFITSTLNFRVSEDKYSYQPFFLNLSDWATLLQLYTAISPNILMNKCYQWSI